MPFGDQFYTDLEKERKCHQHFGVGVRAYLVAGVIRFAYDSSLRVNQLEGDFVFVFRNDGFELSPTGPVAFVVGAQPLNSSTHFSNHSYIQNTFWRYVL